jgi:hypothetical protein
MLVSLCIQVVQTNNNESSWKRGKKQLSDEDKQKICKRAKKKKILNLKNLIDKTQKLIVKELKLNVNCHIKINRNHNLLRV